MTTQKKEHQLIPMVKRVLKGDRVSRAITASGFCGWEVPADGFVFSHSGPGNVPIYVRDEDIERAKKEREEKNRMVSVEAQSWGDFDE